MKNSSPSISTLTLRNRPGDRYGVLPYLNEAPARRFTAFGLKISAILAGRKPGNDRLLCGHLSRQWRCCTSAPGPRDMQHDFHAASECRPTYQSDSQAAAEKPRPRGGAIRCSQLLGGRPIMHRINSTSYQARQAQPS